jgi:carboxypeptidase family protein/TonB-dependent receptor-like protein
MRRLTVMALAAMLCLLLSSAAWAQRLDGSLRVTVTDHSQASVEDAKVTVANEATGVATVTTASSAGTYVFPNLLVGTYTITVEKDGFKKAVQKGIAVASNQTADAKVELELGSVSAVVEVEAGADLVNTQSSELGATFSGKVVNDLPLNTLGGDVKEFAVFAPGTTTQQGGVLGSGGSIGGTRPRFNGFNIDGVEDNKLDTNGPTQPVIQESIAEFTLLTNQFSAEYGHSAGGIFNTVTKSGTNNWHGSAWGYNRNRSYNAFDNQQKQRVEAGQSTDKDRFDYNRAGLTAGGPIIHNKWFIFGAYEFQNEGLAASSPQVTLPTAAGLQTLETLAFDSAVVDILKQFPVAPAQNPCTATTKCTVDVNGNAIPVGDLTTVAPSYVNEHDFSVNSDLTIGKHQLSTRYLYDRIRQPDFNASLPAPQFLGTRASGNHKAIISDVWTLSSHIINNARASYSRTLGPQLVAPSGFEDFPNVIIDDLSTVNIGPEQNAPQSYTQNVYQLADTLNYIRGKHSFKFGIEGKKYISPTNGLPRARGEWDYTTLSQLVNDYVPNGAPNKALRGAGSGSVPENYPAVYWFVQDDWKLTPRLTLNLGLRYEYVGVPEGDKRQALNSISDDPALGLLFRAPKADTNNIAPRIGFAYDPTGHGKWAIRGGAGFAYDVIPNNFAINSLPPQLQTEQKPAVTCALSGRPAWCDTWDPSPTTINSGQGFLAGGGLLQTNVPPATQDEARAATSSLIPDRVSPKIITWTLGVQHELFRDTSVEVRYVGTRSLSLPGQMRLNSASAFDPRFASLGGGLTPLPTYFNTSDVPAVVTAPASTANDFDQFNPQPYSVDGFLGNLTTFPPAGRGIYHAVTVDFIHRFTKGLYFRANYSFSRNIDDATNELFSSIVNPRRAQDGYNFSADRGLSALHIPQKFAVTWVYELPNLPTEHAFLRTLAHGWEWSGSYLAESGQPVTPLSDTDANANGDAAGDRTIFNPNGVGNTGTIVDAVCNSGPGGATSVVAPQASGAYFCNAAHDDVDDAHLVGYVAENPTARFVQAQFGALATAGRNTVTTPGINVWNMSIYKNTRINERFSLQFRAETYNTFNHRNFSIGLPTNNGALDQANNPNPFAASYVNVDDPNFLNSRQFNGGSRTMQLGLRLVW